MKLNIISINQLANNLKLKENHTHEKIKKKSTKQTLTVLALVKNNCSQ